MLIFNIIDTDTTEIDIVDVGLIIANGNDITSDKQILAKSDDFLSKLGVEFNLSDENGLNYSTSESVNLLKNLSNFDRAAPLDSRRQLVQDNIRPINTDTSYYGQNDAPVTKQVLDENGNEITKAKHNYGKGDYFTFEFPASATDNTMTFYIDFDMTENRTYLHSGSYFFSNTNGDHVDLEIVPKVFKLDIDYEYSDTYQGFYLDTTENMIFPNTTGDIINGKQEVKILNFGNMASTIRSQKETEDGRSEFAMSFFNADYDINNDTFINVTPKSPYDTTVSGYNMFTKERIWDRFVNGLPLRGNSNSMTFLPSKDTAQLPINSRIKVTLHRNPSDADRTFIVDLLLIMHREFTT